MICEMTIDHKLAALLESRGWTQAELVRRTGISKQRISRWLTQPDRHRPTLEQAFTVARALGVPLDYLADDDQDEPPPPVATEEEIAILDLVRELRIDRRTAFGALARAAASAVATAPPVTIEPVGPGRVVFTRPESHLLRRSADDPEVNRPTPEAERSEPATDQVGGGRDPRGTVDEGRLDDKPARKRKSRS